MGDESAERRAGGRRSPVAVALVVVLVCALAAVTTPALRVQRTESLRTRCMSMQRRLCTSLLVYAGDADGCLPPVHHRVADGGWRSWMDVLAPYNAERELGPCPVNVAEGGREPYRRYAYSGSYALNLRFSGVFWPGPFPLDNLELPARTVLLAESGLVRAGGPFGAPAGPWVMAAYWDTAWWPEAYPSPHGGKMNVAAADGHVKAVEVAHYTRAGHDPLYGRLGGSFYNWNGGYPNGDTSGEPLE